MSKRKLILFFLSPRLIDFDTYLPVAMEMKRSCPEFDIRFVTFSKENKEYIDSNTTLINGLKQCGTLYLFDTCSRTNNWLAKQLIRFKYFLKIMMWIVSGKKNTMFFGQGYNQFPYIFWYLANFLRGGKGFILLKGRATDDNVHHATRDRLAELPELKAGLFLKLLGKNNDGIIQYHDKQEVAYYGLNTYPNVENNKILTLGLPTLFQSWSELIENEVVVEKDNLKKRDFNLNTEIYSFFPMKSDARNLQSNQSPADTFKLILTTLRKLKPECIILIRLHPVSQKDDALHKILNEINDSRNIITTMHPEVMIKLSDCVLVNGVTNIQTTCYDIKCIDCTDYSDHHYKMSGKKSLADGYGSIFLNPRNSTFESDLENLLNNLSLFENDEVNKKRSALVNSYKPDINNLISWVNA